MRFSHLSIALWMTLKEILRGRLVLLLVVVILSLFFCFAALTSGDREVGFELAVLGSELVSASQQSQMAVFIALATTGLLTSFIGLRLAQGDALLHRRLVLCGYRAHELLLAKTAVLLLVILLLALYVAAPLPLFFFTPRRPELVFAGLVTGAWVYGCCGLLVGAAVQRELPAILLVALLTNLDSAWLQNPLLYRDAANRELIRSLPAHWPSQVSLVGAFSDEVILWPLFGSALYGLGFLLAATWVFAWRLRSR
jgi:hypothetical protein